MKTIQLAMLMSLVTVAIASDASAADRWLCTADKATGFDRDEGSGWKVTALKVERQFIVSRPSELQRSSGYARAEYVVRVIGDQIADAGCQTSNEGPGTQTLNCEGFDGDYRISIAKGRYLYVAHAEYLIGNGEGSDTPFMEIGECSVL